jgi:hypothetical protein
MDKFIQILGYNIRLSSITCVGNIQEHDVEVSKSERKLVYSFELVFDGNRISWSFEKKEEAEKIRHHILNKLEVLNEDN